MRNIVLTEMTRRVVLTMKLSRLVIVTAAVAAATGVAVTIWKRAGGASSLPAGDGSGELGKFTTGEPAEKPRQASLLES